MKSVLNTLVIGAMLLIVYTFAGHDFVTFYFGGETELRQVAADINKLCNDNGSCPTTLNGWQAWGGGGEGLSKDKMLYFVSPGEDGKGGDKKHQEFRLVYRFFMPSKWFEAQGGVGKKISAGWKSR